MKNTQIHLLVVVVCSMLFLGCSETLEVMPPALTDMSAGKAEIELRTSETAWEVQTVKVARSGETLSNLKEETGFGVYSKRLGLQNRKVTWDVDEGRWDYGNKMLWPENRVKYSVSFNGEEKQSTDEYFTLTGTKNFNTKFKNCTYKGITFTSGLELEEVDGNPTTISWKCGDGTVVIIVQSTSDDGTKDNTFKFDDQVLEIDGSTVFAGNGNGDSNSDGDGDGNSDSDSDGNSENHVRVPVYSVEEIEGGRVYTIRNVGAGTHTITRGGSETGILYVSTEAEILAYAPYSEKNGGKPYATSEGNDWLENGKDLEVSAASLGGGFVIENEGDKSKEKWNNITTDLLWASSVLDDNGIANLDFKHALAKLSFGSVVNMYGSAIRLMMVEVSGKVYESGNLSLADGKWSYSDNVKKEFKKEFTYTEEYTTTIDGKETSKTIIGKPIVGGDAELFDIEDLLFIPSPTVTVKIYLQTQDGDETIEIDKANKTDWEGDVTITKTITLEQGKNTEINLTVGRNHEVVIQ